MNKKILFTSLLAILVICAVVAGIYLWKMQKNPVEQLIPVAKNEPVSQQKNGSSNFKVIEGTGGGDLSTKEIFQRLPKTSESRLIRIVSRKVVLKGNKESSDALSFVFYNDADKSTSEINYDFRSGEFSKKSSPILFKIAPEAVPDTAIEWGYEGMKKTLESNQEYVQYKSRYPGLFANCVNTLSKIAQYGWEWKTVCRSSIDGKNASITFATNVETKKTQLIKKENLE